MKYILAENKSEAWIFVLQDTVAIEKVWDLDPKNTDSILYQYYNTQNAIKNFIISTKGYKKKKYVKAWKAASAAFNFREMVKFITEN